MRKYLQMWAWACLFSVSSLSVVSAQEHVKLVYAQPFLYAAGGTSWNYSDYYVHVDNVMGDDGEYKAYIHYEDNVTAAWTSKEMTELGNYGTHRLFYVRIQQSTVQFAVEFTHTYAVSGMTYTQTHWDNNSGADYYISPWTTAPGSTAGAVGGYVGLQQATLSNFSSIVGTPASSFPGSLVRRKLNASLAVQNISPNKSVGIRMTTDNWAHYVDVSATYGGYFSTGGAVDIETWNIAHTFLARLPVNVQFAVYLTDLDTGITYWDNNFTQNYLLNSTDNLVK